MLAKESGSIVNITQYLRFKSLTPLHCDMVIKVLFSTFKIKINKYDANLNVTYEFMFNFN